MCLVDETRMGSERETPTRLYTEVECCAQEIMSNYGRFQGFRGFEMTFDSGRQGKNRALEVRLLAFRDSSQIQKDAVIDNSADHGWVSST